MPQVVIPGVGMDPDVCSGGIGALRTAVNAGSSIIEMTSRGFDIFDRTPPGPSGLPNTDPVNNCVTAFGPINPAGGSGPPSGANQAFLDALFTGTERSIIIIDTTENDIGASVDPSILRHVQQWDGTQWIQYANSSQGSCPIDGPPA